MSKNLSPLIHLGKKEHSKAPGKERHARGGYSYYP